MNSLYDLLQDIIHGRKETFEYGGRTFSVSHARRTWTVTDISTGYKGEFNHWPTAMLDLQGVAACLIEYNRDLVFDREGNLAE